MLLVDDDDSIRTSLGFYFRKKKIPCVPFASAEQALDYLSSHEADLVITDYSLPGLNGLEFIAELQRIQPDIGKILITAYGNFDIAVQGIKLGVHGFIQKPFNTKAVESAIETVMRRLKRETHGLYVNGRRVWHAVDPQRRDDFALTLNKISHDINNSLFRIMGNAQLGLCGVSAQDPVGEKLEHIIREVQQLTACYESLMLLCREPVGEPEQIEIKDTIVGCVDKFRAQATQNGIEIDFDENESAVVIETSRRDFQDIIETLLLNSIQELEALNKPDKRIAIAVKEMAVGSSVSITDSGNGVSVEAFPELFEQGFSTKLRGDGLGLDLVTALIDKLGGSLDIRSQPGEGTTVAITIPAKSCGK